MSGNEDDFKTQVVLSLLRGLWGMIGPHVSAIAATWSNGTAGAIFIFDHPATQSDWEVVREVEANVIADLATGVSTDFTAIFSLSEELPEIPLDGWWVYVRQQPLESDANL